MLYTTVMKKKEKTLSLFLACLILELHLMSAVMARNGKMSYAGLNVTQTVVDMTKANLLRAFGLNLSSKPSKPFVPHEYMIQVFSKLDGQRRDGRQDNVNTVRGLVDNGQDGISWFPFPHLNIAFDTRDLPQSDTLISSELRILQVPSEIQKVGRHRRRKTSGSLLKVSLYGRLPNILPFKRQDKNGTKLFEPVRLILLDSIALDTRLTEMKWLTFQVGSFVQNAMRKGKDKIRFLLRVSDFRTDLTISPDTVGIQKIRRDRKEKPLLVLFMDDNISTPRDNSDPTMRSKRGASKRRRKRVKIPRRWRNKDLCRRRPMYVSFDDFGWTNWIIAPSGYQAYLCSGSCKYPIASHLKPTHHATIQSIIHSNEPTLVPPSCCVPEKLSGISLLYLDGNDRVVYKEKKNMIVERCCCR